MPILSTFYVFRLRNMCLLLSLAGMFFGHAQNKAFPDTLRVSRIAQEQGLSQLNVLGIDFDENGYLWAGTEDGLNRFNGYEMEIFPKQGQGSVLVDDHIRGLVQTGDTLWLATNSHSVIAYVLSQNRFHSIIGKQALKANPSLRYCHRIFELNDQYLLASTLQNCLLIDRNTLDFAVLPLPGQLQDDYVLSLYKRDENSFLLGTYFNGILELDLSRKSLRGKEVFSSLKNNPVYAIHTDGKNNLLLGTEKGLFRYDSDNKKIHVLYRSDIENPIRCFFDWDKNQLLIGCYDGLLSLNKNTYELKPVAMKSYGGKVYSSVEVVEIMADGKGGIWFASEGKGLFYHNVRRRKYEPKRIILPKNPKKTFISIFNFLREDDTLWMATELGFVKHQIGTENYELYRTDRLSYTLAKDGNQNIWGGGFSQGLQKYDRGSNRFLPAVFSKGNIPDADVAQITAFDDDSLWVATWSSGMYSLNLHDMAVRLLKINGKKLSRARASYIDSEGYVWIGADNGLYKICGKKTTHYQHDSDNKNSLSNDRVFSIAEDGKANIWVGTAKGLNKLDPGTDSIFRYEKQPGLPNDFIYGVLADRNGNIWMSTNYGISKLDVETGKFTNYTEKDGLQNNEFNGKAAYEDNLGYLYFGGMDGYNVFHPDSIPTNKSTGKTIIEEVKLFGEPLGKNLVYADTLHFGHNENVLSFGFSALNFLLPEKNRYRFKMEGFDKTWRPITHERSTTYTNLNPGTYTFWVQGSNSDLVWGKADKLVVKIHAPWYKTTLFRIGLALFVLLLITGWFFYRNYRQKQKNLLLQRVVRERTQELQESNEGLNKAVLKAKERKENISFLMRELNHRVKNNLQLMASLLDMQKENSTQKSTQNHLQAAQNRLFTIAKIHDLLNKGKEKDFARLDKFIEILSKEMVSFMGADVQLKFDLAPLKVSQKKINPLGIILNELLTNSLKHAFETPQKDKTISISLKKEGELGKLTYRDNGKGLPENKTEDKKSLGMKLIHNLVLQLDGKVESHAGKGAFFEIRFVL